MSARQLRRLQNLVKSSTGADADDEEEVNTMNATGVNAEYPSTMKPPKASKKTSKKQKDQKPETDIEPSSHVDPSAHTMELSPTTCPVPPKGEKSPPLQPQEKTETHEEKLNHAPLQKKTKDGDDSAHSLPCKTSSRYAAEANASASHSDDSTPIVEPKRPKKGRGRQNNRARRRAEELEEEILLEAALRRSEVENAAASSHSAPLPTDVDLLALLSLCSPSHLDPRQERLRRFGPSAVEDVGDRRAAHRRGTARPNSVIFAQHSGMMPQFRHSALATPNRYTWPPFDGLGMFLEVKNSPQEHAHPHPSEGSHGKKRKHSHSNHHTNKISSDTSETPITYVLNCEARELRQIDRKLHSTIMQHGGVESIFESIGAAPYHLRTLLMANGAFESMGNVPAAQEAIEIALYHVGILLSHFPMRQTARRRQIPVAESENVSIFQTLQAGVHVSLKKGATRTAWEVARLLYSLDSSDPCGILLLLDYLALRAKGWAWLVHIHHVIINETAAHVASITNTSSSQKDSKDPHSNGALALALSTLPGFFFSAALAKFFLEREITMEETAEANSSERKPSKVLRDMTEAERLAMQSSTSANEMLIDAVQRFPSAAVMLVERIGDAATMFPTSSLSEFWQTIVRRHEEIKTSTEAFPDSPQGRVEADGDEFERGVEEGSMSIHIADLWSMRNAEVWRAAEPCGFLRRVLSETTDSSCAATELNKPCVRRTPWMHEAITEDQLMGRVSTAIPAHLLDPVAQTEEDARDEVRRLHRELTPLENDALLRFEALFGPIPDPNLTAAERLWMYESRFRDEDRTEVLGNGENPLLLFLRTFLPWNNTRDMALRLALETAGISDPVPERNRRLRAEDDEFWHRQENEDFVAMGDEESWETEDSTSDTE